MKTRRNAMLILLGLLACMITGLSLDSCTESESSKAIEAEEKQLREDSLSAKRASEPDTWASATDYVTCQKAWAKKDSIQKIVRSLPEPVLCAIVNVVKKTHATFSSEDVVNEYYKNQTIYDEIPLNNLIEQHSTSSNTEIIDTLSYDTIIGSHKVHVVEYTKLK